MIQQTTIPLTNISWEPNVTEKLQHWIKETAAGNLEDLTPQLETYFESYLGRPCIAVNSGTAALHLAIRLLDLKPGTEIIIPTLTYAACANVALYENIIPVFVDVDRDTWCLDPEKLSDAIQSRLKTGAKVGAVMPVHLYGQACPMAAIRDICMKHNIPIIEDVAQAFGGKENEKPLGHFGDYACYSFNANKTISGMGGGLLSLKSQEDKDKLRNIIRHGRLPFQNGIREHVHQDLGFNYQINACAAALMVFQLPHLYSRLNKKRKIFKIYNETFSDSKFLKPQSNVKSGNHTRWLSCFELMGNQVSKGTRDELCRDLEKQGIETRPVFKPLHHQAAYGMGIAHSSEKADTIAKAGICLPSSCDLQKDEQEKVISAIETWFKK